MTRAKDLRTVAQVAAECPAFSEAALRKLIFRAPLNGLEDIYAGIWGRRGDAAWHLVYHQFSADTGGDYGDEVDFVLLYTAPWKQALGLKLAFYQADGFAADTGKIMFWTAWGF